MRALSGGSPPRSSSSLRLALIAFVTIGGFALARFAQRPSPSPPGGAAAISAVPQAAYVRERQWTEPVRLAVRRAAGVTADDGGDSKADDPLLGSLCVLCAEIGPAAALSLETRAEGSPATPAVTATRPAGLDWTFLASLPRPVGLVVRLRAFPASGNGKTDAEVSPAREPFLTLRRTLDEAFAGAAATGFRPAEVQLQFDCPPTQLRGYAACLETLRAAYPGQTFQPVVRPSWLRAADFAPLAQAAGGYVLDLQGLERAGGAADPSEGSRRAAPTTLCDPAAAVDAVESAGRLGVPFRVVLPASGHRLILDADGRLLATSAEPRGAPSDRTPPRPPPGGSERALRANAEDLAELVAAWQAQRPAALRGILWDRLPVASSAAAATPNGERLDWPPETFRAVRAGRVPRGHIEWDFPEPTEGSDRRELALRNVGDAEAPLPPLLTVRCPQPPAAAEAAGPYELVARTPKEHLSPREVRFRLQQPPTPTAAAAPPVVPRTLLPGATLRFGTVRLPQDGDPNAPGTDEMGVDLETATAAPPAAPR